MRLSKLSGHKKLNLLTGDLETALMEVLWSQGPLKGRDLHEAIRREKEIAYTTALTVLDRLAKKGFIKKNRESGMILFSAAMPRQAYRTMAAESLVRKAFDVSPDLAISAFADQLSRMNDADMDRLEKLIRAKKNGDLE